MCCCSTEDPPRGCTRTRQYAWESLLPALHATEGAESLSLAPGGLTLGPGAAAAQLPAAHRAGAAGVGAAAAGVEGEAPQPRQTTCHPSMRSALPRHRIYGQVRQMTA